MLAFFDRRFRTLYHCRVITQKELSVANAADSCASKEQKLIELLRSFGSVVIAFSGGADSAYLAYVASVALGERALAVTGDSASYPTFQRELADQITAEFGIRHEIILTEEFEDLNYTSNPPNRCYYCKSELYAKLDQLARARGLEVICDGTNADDVGEIGRAHV